jgi:hypothetical protein
MNTTTMGAGGLIQPGRCAPAADDSNAWLLVVEIVNGSGGVRREHEKSMGS